MINRDLLEEQEAGWILSSDKKELERIDYDALPLNEIFAVLLKTGHYTILKKTENFDDEVLKISESYHNTIEYLQSYARIK